MRKIKISVGPVSAEAELLENRTADAIWNALPIQARASTWGDEVYFAIPVKLGEDKAREVVDMGDLGYWPPGTAMCIFFGPTPMSARGEIRPASPVNVWGKVSGDAKIFKKARSSDQVVVERLD